MNLKKKIFFLLLTIAGYGAVCAHAGLLDVSTATLPEIKIKETVIDVKPDMKFYLPSGSLDLTLQQKYQDTAIGFSSRYDFVDNFMGFNLDLLYDFLPYSAGIDLNDTVDFNEIFSDSQYLQRSQSISPYLEYALTRSARVRGAVKVENTFTGSLNGEVVLDRGKNIVGEIGVRDDTLQEIKPYPRGGMASLTFSHSFQNLGSDYNYTQAEINLKRYFYPFDNHYFDYRLQMGYPVETANKPLSAIYYAGGYRVLRGYNFKEFRGDAIIYNSVTYNIPLSEVEETKLFGLPLSIWTWNVFFDAAKIGDRTIYFRLSGIKFSMGTGVGYKLVLLKRFPVTLEFSVAKAFENRLPLFYFTVSTIYYSWGNE